MTTQFDLITTAFIVGVSIPIIVGFTYWAAVDTAKRYVDKEIRKVNR